MELVRTSTRNQLDAAYQLFRLERQGMRVSPNTIRAYDYYVPPFLDWLRANHPDVLRLEDLTANHLRLFRALQAARIGQHGRPFSSETLQDSHRFLRAFFNWCQNEGYELDPRIFRLPRIISSPKEPDLFTIAQLRKILGACNPDFPQQELMVRILVGAGLRISEICGLAAVGPDGLPDLMLDSLTRGRAELRVRWDAGAKGRKSRRVPINGKLAGAIKRYELRHRPDIDIPELLVSLYGGAYTRSGVSMVMRRLADDVGFRVHAHAFRHTFATVATQLGWNFERLRAAMGHADYQVLQRYVHLATERDLGPKKDWLEFILTPQDL